MEDKSVRVSEDAHQKLVDYVSDNPVFKMNKVADVAVKHWLELEKEAKIISIIKHGEKQKEG